MNIGIRLKEIRTAKNISARQLALSIGLDPTQISKIENGKSVPSLQSLIKICDSLEISLADFFSDEISVLDQEILNESKFLTTQQKQTLINFLRSFRN
ncbi:hypothetical protein BH747_12020 [Enterococcus villorum]|uniref:HTH cro/C1-type domain-containing protein n=1 Tax=Enterococcus villorum TaxID=112904 RepID=A0A1V8Y735_9ENTE|nr:helix-turn-helix transcriptional regulator [Enterococcus villorum]OQO68402.1 hypothetical protein BH747_12020 [Enterococcus villorum]OQO74349.1 hypothetical protein BH744_07370 [Enterococcus villorum]